MQDFTSLIHNIHNWFLSVMPATATTVVELVIIAITFILLFALLGLSLVYVERKVAAFFQLRVGPTRVGKWGLAQTVADILKLLLKENITIKSADKFLYNLAPFIIIIAPMLVIMTLPFAKGLVAMDINIGIFFVLAASSIGVLGILLGGWASNNKYSLIGAMRSGAQIVSYELSVGLSLLTVVLLTGTLSLNGIVESQANGWLIFKGHIPALIAFVIFIISSTAETNRGPFDIAEAESELTAGFHTEYGGMKFAFFFLAEFINMFIVAAIGATVFLGGWMPFHIGDWQAFNHIMNFIPPIFWFMGKTTFIIFMMMWFRWTFPRLRIDQLLTLEWKYLMPLNLMNIVIMAFLVLMGWVF